MDEIRLYEFDYDKPELSEETLEHHGILFQKWGVRNGPPYPLSSDKSTGSRLKTGGNGKKISKHKARKLQRKRVKSLKKARKIREQNRKVQQEQQKSKDEIIKSKDIAAMFKNVDMFTNQDIQDMLTRLDWEDKLKDRVSKQAEANKPKSKKVVDSVTKAMLEGGKKGVLGVIGTVSENAGKMGIKKMVEAAGGTNEDAQKIIDELFKEKKK